MDQKYFEYDSCLDDDDVDINLINCQYSSRNYPVIEYGYNAYMNKTTQDFIRTITENADITTWRVFYDYDCDQKLRSEKIKRELLHKQTKRSVLEISKESVSEKPANFATVYCTLEFEQLIQNIYSIIIKLKKNGCLIIRIDNLMYLSRVQFVYLLSLCFCKISITKPFYSLATNTEKYIIFHEFNGKKIDIPKRIQSLSKRDNIISIYDGQISSIFKNVITNSNIYYINRQFMTMNTIMYYITGRNLRSQTYNDRVILQNKNNELFDNIYE